MLRIVLPAWRLMFTRRSILGTCWLLRKGNFIISVIAAALRQTAILGVFFSINFLVEARPMQRRENCYLKIQSTIFFGNKICFLVYEKWCTPAGKWMEIVHKTGAQDDGYKCMFMFRTVRGMSSEQDSIKASSWLTLKSILCNSLTAPAFCRIHGSLP